MRFRFLHCADIHLGYAQYGSKERFNDFARALHAVVDVAVGGGGGKSDRSDGSDRSAPEQPAKVDFVLLAGDLFHRRALDALVLNQAMHALRRLRDAGIPCIAVEGNHERAYYEEALGWMRFLGLQDLLILLEPEFKGQKVELRPWEPGRRRGSCYEPLPGVRVHGLQYLGASTAAAVQTYADALAELPRDGIEYTIFMTHAGVEGQLEDKAGAVSYRHWSVLRPHVDYLALGHFHKPFQLEDWIVNPGSPESVSGAEAAWTPRGYVLVDVDTERAEGDAGTTPKHRIAQGDNPRRAFRHYAFKVDQARTPEELHTLLAELVRRRASELRGEAAQSAFRELLPPVIDLALTGTLPFDRNGLDLAAVERLVQEEFQPLVTLVRNLTQPTEFAVDVEQTATRAELERQVFASLFARDARYAADPEAWASLAILLKQMALQEDASAEAILHELARHLAA